MRSTRKPRGGMRSGEGVPHLHTHSLDIEGVPHLHTHSLDIEGVPHLHTHSLDIEGVPHLHTHSLDIEGVPHLHTHLHTAQIVHAFTNTHAHTHTPHVQTHAHTPHVQTHAHTPHTQMHTAMDTVPSSPSTQPTWLSCRLSFKQPTRREEGRKRSWNRRKMYPSQAAVLG